MPSRSSPRSSCKLKKVRLRPAVADYGATAPKEFGAGGKGIRTPDFQLAKLALYQLSYAPAQMIAECGLSIGGCKEQKRRGCCCHKCPAAILTQ